MLPLVRTGACHDKVAKRVDTMTALTSWGKDGTSLLRGCSPDVGVVIETRVVGRGESFL